MDTSLEYYKQKYEPVFGEWKIVKILGEGGFGKVFEIRREEFGMTYAAALKIITVPKSDNELQGLLSNGFTEETAKTYYQGIVNDVAREFVLMSGLKGQSNIVSFENHKVYPHENGFGWDILIQMELLIPLNKYLNTSGLTEETVIKLGIDMCRALELCGKRNIIHRDIKPENVFVNADGDFKLGDFGIARQIEKTQSGLTKIGTPTYMAPEVYKGNEYGFTVDIYSVGVLLYKLLNHNRTPFLPAYPAEITYADMEAALKRRMDGEMLPKPDGTTNKALCDIVLKACSFNPKERFQNASEMKEALEMIGKTQMTAPSKNSNPVSNAEMPQRVQPVMQKQETPNMVNMGNQGNIPANKSQKNINQAQNIPAVTEPVGYVAAEQPAAVIKKEASGKKHGKTLPVVAATAVVVLAAAVIASVLLLGNKNKSAGDAEYGTAEDYTPVITDTVLSAQKCGANVYWELDDEGTLTFTGTGKMDNWTIKATSQSPWKGSAEIKKVVIGEGIESVGECAFYGCSELAEITIPKSVTYIGELAFCHCSKLDGVVLPDGIKAISSQLFSGCSSLTSIEIPNSVKSIGNAAFFGCKSLANITVPDSVTNIDFECFAGCDAATIIANVGSYAAQYAAANNMNFAAPDIDKATSNYSEDNIEEQGVLLNSVSYTILKDKTLVIHGNGNMPDWTEETFEIRPWYGKGIKSVVIEDGILDIGDYAFRDCYELSNITIPKSVTSIGEYAFGYCGELSSLNIPKTVTSIDSAAFFACTGLTSIVIPYGVTSIGEYTFSYCEGLSDVVIPDSVTYIESGAFLCCPKLTSVIVPVTVNHIAEWAFADCKLLENVEITNPDTSFDENAFDFCPVLTIKAPSGSNAEAYAKENNLGFVTAK